MNFSPDLILAYLQDSSRPQRKADIARVFGVKGAEARGKLKAQLKQLEESGCIIKHSGGAYGVAEGLPAVTIIEVTEIDIDGDVFAVPTDEAFRDQNIRIEVMPDKKGHPALKEGDRTLAALKKRPDGVYEAKILKKLDDAKGRVLGLVVRAGKTYNLEPANKKIKDLFEIAQDDLSGAGEGDLVVGEIQPARGLKRKKVRIIEIIGAADDPKAISLLSAHESGLRMEFPLEVHDETDGMNVPKLDKREDLRPIPLITIDGEDARDFDDAVYAEPAKDGWHLIVAIADVSYYVRPESVLDREAQARGNSTYFPDRVVPMLPEALSNDLCSLRPDEDRACLAAHLWIDKEGRLIKHKFVRGLMRSHARCTYEYVQALWEQKGEENNPVSARLLPLITHLYTAYEILSKARAARGALDIEMPERQVLINEHGEMTGVRPRVRLKSHKLIEEFMVLANVAAAEALEAKSAPCMYRVHEPPKGEKLQSAGEFIQGFGLSLPNAQSISPRQLNRILHKASASPYAHLVHEVILRTQSQARYSPENLGHYGLALARYAHFTSPIRRYADLLVHRALVGSYGLGEGGLSKGEEARFEELGVQISQCERKSVEAERSALDRFTAAYLAEQVGAEFAGRISGVTRFGLFVSLAETGADGIIPMRALSDDYYVHDEERHALIGRRKGFIYRLGAEVTVRIKEADGLTGSTVFELVGHKRGADIPGFEEPKHLKRRKARSPDHKKTGRGKGRTEKVSKPAAHKQKRSGKGSQKKPKSKE